MKLHGRVVLVTGASRGIGAAVASAVVATQWFRPAVVVRHLVPPMLRWGTKRSFRDELAADGATR